jgi:two-component system response regulator
LEILLVEDNPGDVRLVQETLREIPLPTELSIVADGARAMAFLRHHGPYGRAPRPDLILLDLDLPGLDGREFLRIIKSDYVLYRIPVVILTSSQADEDVLHTSALRIKSYVNKPIDVSQLRDILYAVQDFWENLDKPPRAEPP